MNQEDRLAKLEKRRKSCILLRIFGNIRKRQNLSSYLVTPDMEPYARERVILQRYDPSIEQSDAPGEEGVQISKIDWSFFANPLSFVVSGQSSLVHTLCVLAAVQICNYFLCRLRRRSWCWVGLPTIWA